MRIELRIDRLVLEGLPLSAAQGELVQKAIEAELARLLAEGGLAQSWDKGAALAAVQAAGITLSPGGSPAQMGAQIAQSVYSSLGGAPSGLTAEGASKDKGRALRRGSGPRHASTVSEPGRSGAGRRGK